MKYLVKNPLTRRELDIWATNPSILPHFFWKPGSELQRNVKGFLYSVLHQVISHGVMSLDLVLAAFESTSLEESDADWSERVLK
ncbi:hypothetical protein GGS26DRAFT_559909 [Hypomontagnella submonticulosa]|nr:hypothetical protein GGS26DRAFT_559909 [Hypomontagnella submonticulosa]